MTETHRADETGAAGMSGVQPEGVVVGHPAVAPVVHDEQCGAGGEWMRACVIPFDGGCGIEPEAAVEAGAESVRGGGVEPEVTDELGEERLGCGGPGDDGDGGDRAGRPGDGQRREPAEGVSDESGEGAVGAVQLLRGIDPVADIGVPPAGGAVRRGIEGDDPESLGDEFPHERGELGGAAPPAVQEQHGARTRAPRVGRDGDAAHEERPAAGVVVGGGVGGTHGHPWAGGEEQPVGEIAGEERGEASHSREGADEERGRGRHGGSFTELYERSSVY